MNIAIRKAVPEDARGIVEVNTYTWLTTYKGLMPDKLLEDRLKNMEERIPIIENNIKEKKSNLYVAESDEKIVGIMSYGKSKDDKYTNSGEIYTLYVLEEYQGLGIGKKLFLKALEDLIDNGYNSMVLNVLDGNKTIDFYKKYSGVKVDSFSKSFGGTELIENVMYFDNIEKIYEDNKIERQRKK